MMMSTHNEWHNAVRLRVASIMCAQTRDNLSLAIKCIAECMLYCCAFVHCTNIYTTHIRVNIMCIVLLSVCDCG